MSGVPNSQPSGNFGGAGRSLAAPSTAPSFTHRWIALICSGRSRRSPTIGNSPRAGSHGGICPVDVSAAIASACSAASAYVSSENGATPPGRWQGAQFANTMGAISLLNVTGAGAGGGVDLPQPATPAIVRTAKVTPAHDTATPRAANDTGKPRMSSLKLISRAVPWGQQVLLHLA